MFILDTCIFSDLQRNKIEIKNKLESMNQNELGITAISILEVIGGWQDALRHSKDNRSIQERISVGLLDAISLFNRFQMLPYTEAAMLRYETLKKVRPAINVRGPDLRIASIAIEANATVITYNARDFKRIPHVQYIQWKSPAN